MRCCNRCGGHYCGIGTRKGAIFAAFYSVFTAVVCMSMMLLRFTAKVDVEIQTDFSALSYGSLAVYSIHIIVSFVLLAGANLDRRGTFIPWVAWTVVVMFYEGLAVILYFSASKHKQKGFRRWDLFCSLFYAGRTAINIYCLICLTCRYRALRPAMQETPCTYVFPSPEQCERRPRLQKDLITIMESAFKQSSQNVTANTLIVMPSLPPPPYAKTPPPYGDHAKHRGRPETSRVVVEYTPRDTSHQGRRGTDGARLTDLKRGEITFLKEHHNCQCDGYHERRSDTKLRHGTVVWDDSDPENDDRQVICNDATIYRNPMIHDTNRTYTASE